MNWWSSPLCLFVLVAIVLPQEAAAASKPNLLFIVTDQHRYDAIGIIQQRMKDYVNKIKVRTPNIDALARRGVTFDTGKLGVSETRT